MKTQFKFLVVIVFNVFTGMSQELSEFWVNPISEGLNPYGIKDCHIYPKNDSLYLVGTEYPNPFQEFTGPSLYSSKNGKDWLKVAELITTTNIPSNAWYKNGWKAPELFHYNGYFYFTFNNRNNSDNPYQKLGFGIAKSKSIYGPFEVINKEKPIVLSNHGSITISKSGTPYLTYDMDGIAYITEINLKTGETTSKPQKLLDRDILGKHYKYVDAVNITKINNTYHLLFTQFYGGYVVKVFHMTSKNVTGPWQWSLNNPIYEFKEEEADQKVKMKYAEKYGFAPPTQVVFSHDIVNLNNNNYLMVYHSSEKYSEPYLCLEKIEVNTNNELHILAPKQKKQHK